MQREHAVVRVRVDDRPARREFSSIRTSSAKIAAEQERQATIIRYMMPMRLWSSVKSHDLIPRVGSGSCRRGLGGRRPKRRGGIDDNVRHECPISKVLT